jgi:hypothetical protein
MVYGNTFEKYAALVKAILFVEGKIRNMAAPCKQ